MEQMTIRRETWTVVAQANQLLSLAQVTTVRVLSYFNAEYIW